MYVYIHIYKYLEGLLLNAFFFFFFFVYILFLYIIGFIILNPLGIVKHKEYDK